METHAEQLMFENISKNMSDSDEYPALMQVVKPHVHIPYVLMICRCTRGV